VIISLGLVANNPVAFNKRRSLQHGNITSNIWPRALKV